MSTSADSPSEPTTDSEPVLHFALSALIRRRSQSSLFGNPSKSPIDIPFIYSFDIFGKTIWTFLRSCPRGKYTVFFVSAICFATERRELFIPVPLIRYWRQMRGNPGLRDRPDQAGTIPSTPGLIDPRFIRDVSRGERT